MTVSVELLQSRPDLSYLARKEWSAIHGSPVRDSPLTPELEHTIMEVGAQKLITGLMVKPDHPVMQASLRAQLTQLEAPISLLETVENVWNPDISLHEQITNVWDLVQGFEYGCTFGPMQTIEQQKMECSTRTFVMGTLAKRFLPSDVITLVDLTSIHASCMFLQLPKGTTPLAGYFADPTARQFTPSNAIFEIKNPDLLAECQTAIDTNPDNIDILFEHPENECTYWKHHNYRSFDPGIKASLWLNLATYTGTDHMAEYANKRATELAPNCATPWFNLSCLTSRQLSIQYLLKCVELDPEYYYSYRCLSHHFPLDSSGYMAEFEARAKKHDLDTNPIRIRG